MLLSALCTGYNKSVCRATLAALRWRELHKSWVQVKVEVVLSRKPSRVFSKAVETLSDQVEEYSLVSIHAKMEHAGQNQDKDCFFTACGTSGGLLIWRLPLPVAVAVKARPKPTHNFNFNFNFNCNNLYTISDPKSGRGTTRSAIKKPFGFHLITYKSTNLLKSSAAALML